MSRQKKDPSLTRIIIIILAIGSAVLVTLRLADWFVSDIWPSTVAASADESLAAARSLMDEGNLEQAREALEPIIRRVDDPLITPKAMLLLVEVEERAGNQDRVRELLRDVTQNFPESPERPRAAVRYARLLEADGNYEEAVKIYQDVSDTAPHELRAPALSGLGREALRQNDDKTALERFRQAVVDAEWDSPDWREAVGYLGDLNTKMIFAEAPTAESKVYTVEAGDNLVDIGVKLNTTLGLLTRANGIDDPRRLYPGQSLKYTPKDFRIIIERATCRLFLMDKDGIFKIYPLGLGRPGHETTLGVYKIGNKIKDPTWHKPGAGPIPPGDPRNELGTRWMPLVPVEQGLPTDLGIHGTIEPETIGQYCSSGCPRMLPADVEELYDLIVRSTPVEIVEKMPPQ